MPDNVASRIEKLKQRKAKIDRQLARAKAKVREEERRLDTRRKILIGAVVLAEAAADEKTGAWLRDVLGRRLTEERDRVLFPFLGE